MIKIGLYSVTYAGIWYSGAALSIEDIILKAKALDYDGVELDLKRPHGFPWDLGAERRKEIRSFAADQGVELPVMAANNNFSSPIAECREAELALMHEQIRLTSELGARHLRVFAAWRGITFKGGLANYEIAALDDRKYWHDSTRLERWQHVRACLAEAARWAGDYGVVLTLQNHRPLIDRYQDMIEMVQEVGSPNLQCNLDCSNCGDQQGDEYLAKAVRETGKLQANSHFGGEWERGADGKLVNRPWDGQRVFPNYPAFVRALKQNGYQGYMNYELCHQVLRGHDVMGLDTVNEQAAFAVEYMRDLVKNV